MDERGMLVVTGDAIWIEWAKDLLAQDKQVTLKFQDQISWKEKRKEIYRNFRNEVIKITRLDRYSAIVTITSELIRTSRVDKETSEERTRFPKTIPLGHLKEFSRPSSHYTLDQPQICACCGESLPLSEFATRSYNGVIYRQAYCKHCHNLYNIWRRRFLKEHNADRLTPEFTQGNKQRNELFRSWYEDNY